jgi:hypothetical protein
MYLAVSAMRTGLWCERCALPSRVEVDALWLRESGVTVLGTFTTCTDCGDGGDSCG